jgi:hypothetical protein
MKSKSKIASTLLIAMVTIASCNFSKPSEKPDTDGKDSIVNDTTGSSVPRDTTNADVQDSVTTK